MFDRGTQPTIIIGSFASALLTLALIGLLFPSVRRDEKECIGEAIAVDEAYAMFTLYPHSCRPQCADQKPRFLLYKNGLATQCEELPGCRDLDEDLGVTCRPPQGDKPG